MQTINTPQGTDKNVVITFTNPIDSYTNIAVWIVTEQNSVVSSGTTPLKFAYIAKTGHITGYITKTAVNDVTFKLPSLYTKAMQVGVYKMELWAELTAGNLKSLTIPLLINVTKSAAKDL